MSILDTHTDTHTTYKNDTHTDNIRILIPVQNSVLIPSYLSRYSYCVIQEEADTHTSYYQYPYRYSYGIDTHTSLSNWILIPVLNRYSYRKPDTGLYRIPIPGVLILIQGLFGYSYKT